ncbi:MAG TPA: FAD-dependent oxidoreductase [Vicinamibacterales bacterium]|nr:FAD-dependent oxidoreductase [Vicinamibacterales bacterium]
MQTLLIPTRTVVAATPRTKIIVADLGDRNFSFRAGQAVFAGLAESPVKRPYSIACSPQQAGRDKAIELLVQIDDHTAPDPHLEGATPGTLLRIEGPFGSFALPAPLPERRVLLIAGGTGIAPLRSIMWHLLETASGVDVTLVYSARRADEFAYLAELGSLKTERRIDLFLTVTRESDQTWTGTQGRVDSALLTSVLDTQETRCVICGPSGFVGDVSALLTSSGVPRERIVTETYAADSR